MSAGDRKALKRPDGFIGPDGSINLAKMTPEERIKFALAEKYRRRKHAENTGANMYNFHATHGRKQTSFPAVREQRVFNKKANKVITIKHFE